MVSLISAQSHFPSKSDPVPIAKSQPDGPSCLDLGPSLPYWKAGAVEVAFQTPQDSEAL